MPQVPYQPVPAVTPSGVGRNISISTPGAAFGENISQAVQHLGQVTEHAGNEIFSRAMALQEVQNQSDARDAITTMALEMTDAQNKFDAAEGANGGPDALRAHNEGLAAIRDKWQGQLKTPIAQKLYAQESQSFFLRNIFSAGAHA